MKREIGLILACAGLAACLYFATWPFGENARDNAFLSAHAGARLAASPDTLYSVDAARSVIAEVQPGAVFRPVARPPFYYAWLRPLGSLAYANALGAWQVVGLLCLVAFALLWTRPGVAGLAWIAVFVPVWTGLARGGDVTWYLLVAAMAALFMRRRWPMAAGFTLSLLAAKPHVFLLVGVFGLCVGLRFLAGFLAGGAVWYAVSAAMMSDWLWPLAYADYLTSPTGGNIVCQCEVDQGMLIAAAVLAAVLCAWLWRRRPSFHDGLAVAMAASLVVAQRPSFHDAAYLLPLSVVMLSRRRPWGPLAAAVVAIAAWHWAGWPAARWAVAAMLGYSAVAISREPEPAPLF